MNRTPFLIIVLLVMLAVGAAPALAGTDVGGHGNTLTGSDQSSGSGLVLAPGPSGQTPVGDVLVVVPLIVGPNQYCLTYQAVPAGTVLQPFNPVGSMSQVPCPATAP